MPTGVLMFFQGGSDVSLQEVFASSQLVREAVHPEANIIFGVVVDDTLGERFVYGHCGWLRRCRGGSPGASCCFSGVCPRRSEAFIRPRGEGSGS